MVYGYAYSEKVFPMTGDLEWEPLKTMYKDISDIARGFLTKCRKKKLATTASHNPGTFI